MHLLTQSALLQALGWTLINSLWQMGLLWLAYWLLTQVFHSASPRFRHSLALALLAFGALGSLVTFTAGYFFGERGWSVPAAGGWAAGNRLILSFLPYCSTLYLGILVLLLIRYSHQYLLSRRLGREGLSKLPAEFRVFVTSTSLQMGIGPRVSAWLSSRVDVPMTLGSLKPIILLPVAMMSQLTPQQVEAILVHELAHIRRNDYLLNLCVTVIGLLFFFNPFSRLLIRQLQKQREHCCDDEVLQFRYDAHAYVSALLSLARQHRQGRLALAATGDGDDQWLLQRARRILQQKRTDRRPGARPFILLFLTAAIAGLSLSAPTPQAPPATPTTRPAATGMGEIAFIPIVNTGAPQQSSSANTGSLRRETNARPRRSEAQPGRAEAGMLGMVASADRTPAANGPDAGSDDHDPSGNLTGVLTQPAALTITVAPPAPRDNSLGKSGDDEDDPVKADDIPALENLVFVPNSSFSSQPFDTLRSQDKLAWVEASTAKTVRTQVEKLVRELESQLEQLRRLEGQARDLNSTSRQELKRLLNEQLLIQRNYLRKLDALHGQLRKGRRLTTVYI